MISFLRKLYAKKEKQNLFEGLTSFDTREKEIDIIPSVLITGVGRSGTHFMAKLFEQSSDFRAMHLDDIGDAVGDAYNWFCKWHQPEMEMPNFVQSRLFLAHQSSLKQKRFLESNPMIALMIEDLIQPLKAKTIVMLRHPQEVVVSHFQKGWYQQNHEFPNIGMPDYPYKHQRPNHFFSRITPKHLAEQVSWKKYDTLGKIAWMWMAVNRAILKQIDEKQINDRVKFVYLNSFDYNEYKCLMEWVECRNVIAEHQFNAIVSSKPGKGKNTVKPMWTEKDKFEFNFEIDKVINQFAFISDCKNWKFK